jgi:hypothetical protein
VLTLVKLLHTVVWAFFAGCIVVIPYYAWQKNLAMAWLLIGIVMVEVLVLLFNRFRCPLTGVAARYTRERADNFDIYLPLWVARYNKLLFGGLFIGGVLYTLAQWRLG